MEIVCQISFIFIKLTNLFLQNKKWKFSKKTKHLNVIQFLQILQTFKLQTSKKKPKRQTRFRTNNFWWLKILAKSAIFFKNQNVQEFDQQNLQNKAKLLNIKSTFSEIEQCNLVFQLSFVFVKLANLFFILVVQRG